MSQLAAYSVSRLPALAQKTSLLNASVVVGVPYSAFSVPPTTHVLLASTAASFFINVLPSSDSSRRWIAMAGTPAVGYELPSGTPPFIGIIAINTVAQSVAISINTAGASGDWIDVSGNGAGTAF